MILLGLDSAGAGASAALWRDGAIVAARSSPMPRGQAEILMPMIAEVLADAKLGADALDAVGVAVGPGSFTGLRIAIAAARGIALARGIPALGVSSFATIAAQAPAGEPLLVALDTRRDDFYLQVFDSRREPRGEPALLSAEAAARWLPGDVTRIAGDAAARLARDIGRDLELVPGTEQARAENVARLAVAAFAPGRTYAPPRPVYLRAPDTTEPRARAAS